MDQIARELIRYRHEKDLTQRELAKLAGTSYSQISRLENGEHSPNISTLVRIGKALGLDLTIGFAPTESRDTQSGQKRAVA